MKEKIIENLNDLFAKRAEFYAFFDENIPHIKGTQLFDFEKLSADFGKNSSENLPRNCGENSSENSRFLNKTASENFNEKVRENSHFLGENHSENADKISSKNSAKNSQNLGQKSVNLRKIYELFHNYDYAIRKLLPSLYKAYEIDTSKDLKSDF